MKPLLAAAIVLGFACCATPANALTFGEEHLSLEAACSGLGPAQQRCACIMAVAAAQFAPPMRWGQMSLDGDTGFAIRAPDSEVAHNKVAMPHGVPTDLDAHCATKQG